MNKIKDNKGITNMTLITIVLVIIILMLLAAVIYLVKNPNTTYITQNSPTEQSQFSSIVTENNKETVNENVQVSNNVISNSVDIENQYKKIKGTYTYQTTHPEVQEVLCDYQLSLKEDGTFDYKIAIDNCEGFCGNYIINGSQIILNKLFNYGSDVGIGIVDERQIRLIINEDKSIEDTNVYEWSPIKKVVLKKEKTEPTETLKKYLDTSLKYYFECMEELYKN